MRAWPVECLRRRDLVLVKTLPPVRCALMVNFAVVLTLNRLHIAVVCEVSVLAVGSVIPFNKGTLYDGKKEGQGDEEDQISFSHR